MAYAGNIHTWRARASESFRADPKKAMTLAVLSVVLLVMWGRMLFTGASLPTSARANPAGSADANGSVIGPEKATSQASIDSGESVLSEWLRAPVQPVGRNLFSIKLDYYPKDGSRAEQVSRTPREDGFWDQLAKSMHVAADQRKERQILVQNLRERAQELRLQSIVMSTPRQALINDQLLSEGDMVEGFHVIRIESRRVIVEREEIKLEILMQ